LLTLVRKLETSANISMMARTTVTSSSARLMNTAESLAYNDTLCRMVGALSEDNTPAESARWKRALRDSIESTNSSRESGCQAGRLMSILVLAVDSTREI
jgi:hypothetical protein